MLNVPNNQLNENKNNGMKPFLIPKIGKEGVPEKRVWERYNLKVNVYRKFNRDFPGGTVVKNLPVNAGDTGLIPGPGRSHMLRSN